MGQACKYYKWELRKINPKKGLTLVEIVIAIAILFVFVGMFAYSMTLHFRRLHETRTISENVFVAAKAVEHEMQDIRAYMEGIPVTPPLQSTVSRTMFTNSINILQREINYYPVTHQINNELGNPSSKTVHCVVADVRPPEFEVPVIESNSAFIRRNTDVVDFAYAAETDDPSVSIRLETEVTVDRDYLLLMMRYQWYTTNSSFPMRWTEFTEIDNSDVGIRIPAILRDFEVIPGAQSPLIIVDETMAGQHLVCLMTPASFDGRMGRAVPTTPIHIHGLPIVSNLDVTLAAHYDASLIDIPNVDYEIISGAQSDRIALRWSDISNNGATTNNVVGGGDPPRLLLEDFPQLPNRRFPIRTQYVEFSNTGIPNRGLFGVNTLSLDPNFTMFAVVRIRGSNSIIAQGSSWAFDAASYSGLAQDEWHILGLRSDGMRTVGENADTWPNNTSPGSGGGGAVRIGGSGGTPSNIDLTELVMYNGLMDPLDMFEITQYLAKKYNID